MGCLQRERAKAFLVEKREGQPRGVREKKGQFEGKEEEREELFLGIQRSRVSGRSFFGFPCSFRIVTVSILRCFVYLNGHFINKSLCFIYDIFVIYLDA